MSTDEDLARRLAQRYQPRWLRSYVRSKLRTDPVYRAAFELFHSSRLPILDVGCGIGLLAFYLRERGLDQPIVGVDIDRVKIERARSVARHYRDVRFQLADDDEVETSGNVALLDVLHYLTDDEQRVMLRRLAAQVAPEGTLMIRDCPRDRTLRYAATWIEEVFARGIGWMRTRVLNFPRRELFSEELRPLGFREEVRPLWGRTPFNSHLFIYRR